MCSKCREEKPCSDFRARKGARDGLHGWCNPCYNAYYSQASREWRQKHRERQRANDRRRYAANPEMGRERSQRWRERNRELVNQRAREAHHRYWRDPKKRAQMLSRMHARRLKVQEGASAEMVEQMAAMYEMPCTYCGSTEDIEIDHIYPLSRGGKHELRNITPACGFCNRSKKNRLLSEWLGVCI